MDLDHYKIESMKAVSEGKCLIVGFALTAFKDITWYLYCTAPITHTCKIIQTCSFRPELSVIPLFHISLLKEQGQKERYEAGTKKKPQECLHKLSWHVALCKILTHLSIHFWDSPTAISHWGNHFSSLGTLTVKSAAHKKLHCSQLCFDISMAPSTRTGHASHTKSKCTRLSKMLHFSFVFGACLHKPEEFGVICFGGQALALQMFPFL